MKAEELKGKTADELSKTLIDLKKKQFNLRIQKSQGQLENTAQIRAVRKDIARVKTFMGQLAGAAGQKADAKAKPAAKTAAKKAKATAKKSA
ncbi:MAG: 50S ribosomal protein L29 [Chloroflexi bacterium]|nr:50S ribosomal protein L29 [Chloroflexota bacterium]